MTTTDDARTWEGRTLYDNSGDKVGDIDAIYLDRGTDEPEWATVNTGLFGLSSSFVPLRDARATDDGVAVTHSKDKIKDAPSIDPDGEISEEEEQRLYEHYDLTYEPYDDGHDDDRDDVDRDADLRTDRDHDRDADLDRERDTGVRTDDATTVTRSEEELAVGTTREEKGRVRLRKYVETDTVTETVPVEREKVRVEREPVDGDEPIEGDLVEDEQDIVVSEEEVVVDKRTVPKEQVRLEKDVERDEVEVSEEVRREQLEVDDDTDGTRTV